MKLFYLALFGFTMLAILMQTTFEVFIIDLITPQNKSQRFNAATLRGTPEELYQASQISKQRIAENEQKIAEFQREIAEFKRTAKPETLRKFEEIERQFAIQFEISNQVIDKTNIGLPPYPEQSKVELEKALASLYQQEAKANEWYNNMMNRNEKK